MRFIYTEIIILIYSYLYMHHNIPLSNTIISALIKVIEVHNETESIINIWAEDIKKLTNYWNHENITEFIYDIAEYDTIKFIRVLSYILDIVHEDHKKEIIRLIKLEKNIEYFNDNYIREELSKYNKLSQGDQISYIWWLENEAQDYYEKRDLITSKIYQDNLLVIEWTNFWNIYFYKSSFKSDENVSSNMNRDIVFRWSKLLYRWKERMIKGNQLRFCKYLFRDNKINEDNNWEEFEEFLYWKNYNNSWTGLVNIIKKINLIFNELWYPKYLSYSQLNEIQLISR